ncbi:MAG: hypothetical protein OWQ54_05440 [Sulfolobaceae archaeon]|nr:hypothetical protein [Sulfolobaceae archaeon]
MNKNIVLIVLLVIVFIVGAVGVIYLNSEITTLHNDYANLATKYNSLLASYSTLYTDYTNLYSEYTSLVSSYNSLSSNYNTLRSYYSTLYSMFESLNASYYTLNAQYSSLKSAYTTLSSQYATVSSEFNSVSGYMTVANFISYMIESNTQGMVNEMKGPYQVTLNITAVPGQGSIIANTTNTTALTYITSHLSDLFQFVQVRGFIRDVIFSQYGNFTLGEALIAYSDVGTSGPVNMYLILTVVAREVSLGQWQVVYVNVDNSLYIYQYHFAETAFTLLSALEQRNTPQLITLLIGPFPQYVYIATGPFAGNYTGAITVESKFIDTIIGKNITAFAYTPLYFTLQSPSNSTATVTFYGNMSLTLTNGTTLTYPTELEIVMQLEPNGQVQVTGLNILNNIPYTEILSSLPE